MDRKIFQNPGPEYRGKPFWAWNGELKKEEIAFQIGCLKEMGFGGAFLHSRTGLATEYMSDEWMRLVGYASELLNDQGMQAYLYDEDRWPSGTCGGLVTKTKEFRAKSMVVCRGKRRACRAELSENISPCRGKIGGAGICLSLFIYAGRQLLQRIYLSGYHESRGCGPVY